MGAEWRTVVAEELWRAGQEENKGTRRGGCCCREQPDAEHRHGITGAAGVAGTNGKKWMSPSFWRDLGERAGSTWTAVLDRPYGGDLFYYRKFVHASQTELLGICRGFILSKFCNVH